MELEAEAAPLEAELEPALPEPDSELAARRKAGGY